jgi:HEPN domain
MKHASLTVKIAGPDPRNPVSIFNHAQGFYLAGNRCLLDIEVGPSVTQCLVSPGVVNLCLSIELFLKSVIIASGGAPPKTHKLLDLVPLLPAGFMEKIELRYRGSVSEPTLGDLLSQVNEFFVKLRYEYEFDVFAFQESAVLTLAKALYLESAALHGIKSGIERILV